MKKIIIITFILGFSLKTLYAQNDCRTDDYFHVQLEQNPSLQDSLDLTTNNYVDFMSQRSVMSTQTIYIPVVFHVVYSDANPSSNISDAQVQSALNMLNQGFGTIQGSSGKGVVTDIVFCLANRDPLGNPTSGITRFSSSLSSFLAPNSLTHNIGDDNSLKYIDNWPSQNYLNIWICDIQDDGVKGYTSFPWQSWLQDGMVLDYQYISGPTIIHEAGHWCGLWHTNEEQGSPTQSCTNTFCDINGDQVCDTPPEHGYAYYDPLINSSPVSCSTRHDCHGNFISAEDYMEYNFDNCQTFFTQGQRDRMRYLIYQKRVNFYNYSVFYPSLLPIACSPVTGGSNDAGDNSLLNSCSTIEFTINGKPTGPTDDIVNVCDQNIIITPNKYNSTCGTSSNWLYLMQSSDFLCAHTSNMWQAASKNYDGILGTHCYCWWFQLFIEVQECDANKNPIGSGINQWFFIHDADQSVAQEGTTFKSFNLYNYLPSGASIEAGKYYKIKIASYYGGDNSSGQSWLEYNGYVRVYKDDLIIQNQTITHDQFANNITMINTSVPAYADIQVVAKTKIEILPTTTLENGVYRIDYFDCTSLDQFRALEQENSPPYALTHSNVVNNSANYSVAAMNELSEINKKSNSDSKEIATNNFNSLKIYPNPATNIFNIDYETTISKTITINLCDLNNNIISNIVNKKNLDSGTYTFEFNCSTIPDGVYFIRLTAGSENIIKKVIILK